MISLLFGIINLIFSAFRILIAHILFFDAAVVGLLAGLGLRNVAPNLHSVFFWGAGICAGLLYFFLTKFTITFWILTLVATFFESAFVYYFVKIMLGLDIIWSWVLAIAAGIYLLALHYGHKLIIEEGYDSD